MFQMQRRPTYHSMQWTDDPGTSTTNQKITLGEHHSSRKMLESWEGEPKTHLNGK